MLDGKHIFVVDDDFRNRLIYKVLLPQCSATYEVEGWGPDVLDHLERCERVDLIIMDLMLPYGISGYDLCSRIRALPQYDGIPIVAISASDPDTAIPRAKEMGFSGYIAKPVDQSLFPTQLVQILDGEGVWHPGNRFANVHSSY
jgi:CheY-like chemotaxis protein